jgi:hypothetical protein
LSPEAHNLDILRKTTSGKDREIKNERNKISNVVEN